MSDKNLINIDYTTIDYDALKAELVRYLKETKTFADVDVAASNINTLIGYYSYLGSLFGYYINSIANEPFLSTAKRYKNLNRIAKLLSYNPKGYKAASVDVVGSLDPSYCFGKEGTFIEVPAYSLFPADKTTPSGEEFSFTNEKSIVYMIKGFGINSVQQNDFTYSGFSLPHTANSSFWGVAGSSGTSGTSATSGTSGTSGTPYFIPENIELVLSDTSPLSILDRLDDTKLRPFDETIPLFNVSSNTGVGQPFTRNIAVANTTLRIEPDVNYYVVFSYDQQLSAPYLELLVDGPILEERRDDIITVLRLVKEDASGNFWTLKEIQNNSTGRFYKGVLGCRNLSSVQFSFDKLESTVNGIKQIHIDINKDGGDPPLQVLVNGVIYSFSSGRISSQLFDSNSFDVTQPYYNVNLTIVTPDAPDFNYDAKLTVTTKAPNVNEVTIARIYSGVVDSDTGTETIRRDAGQVYGNFQYVPVEQIQTSDQKTGRVEFKNGITQTNVIFDIPFQIDGDNTSDYIISLTPTENVQTWYTSKNETGFIIFVEPEAGFEGYINWIATKINSQNTRDINIVFDEPMSLVDGSYPDYTIFLTPSENVRVWYENKSSEGFTVKVEKSFTGQVSYSTFVFSDNETVLSEQNSSTQKKGSVNLSGDQTTKQITFDSPFKNTEYGLHMVANKNVNIWYTNKTIDGFVINVESIDGNIIVDWFADFSTEYKYQKHGTINFSGQISNSGVLPGLRFINIPETFLIHDLKQGSPVFSFINRNGIIDNGNNGLSISFSGDRKTPREIRFQIQNSEVSYDDIRIFIKNSGGVWEEWENASLMSASADISVGRKVFFARVEDTRNVEIWFGNGTDFGTDPYGSDMYIFGLTTVGTDGNIPPNTLSDSIILSKYILGDDNITVQFEKQFIDFIGLKSNTYFAAGERTISTVLYDSEGTRITEDQLRIVQNNPAFGGSFPETTEELRYNASSSNLRQDRIVSIDDYATFVISAFKDIILRAKALSYTEAIDSGFITQEDSKYFFNYVFLVVLPKVGTEITQKQKEYILDTLNKKYKSMATVEHELFSAKNVKVDVRARIKATKVGNISSIQTNVEKVIREFFSQDKRELGETIHHSDIIAQITSTVSNIDYIELAMHKNYGKLTKADYDIDAVTKPEETVAEVKRRKILELLAKDSSLLTIVEPLLDVTDSKTGKKEWVFSLNITMEKYEFPILGDIILEFDGE